MRIGQLFAGWVLMAFAGLAAAMADDDPIVIYTEDFPPYNFQAADGTVTGSATHNVRTVMDASGLDYQIKVVPWTRAMHAAVSDENALIYTIARTPDRQDKFDWLVPLFYSEFYLFVRADETRAVTLEALRAGQFRTTCVMADVSCELLKYMQVPTDAIRVMPNDGPADLRLVLAGRADIYVHDLAANDTDVERIGAPAGSVRPAMRIDYNGGFFLAAGMQVPEAVRSRIRATYETLSQAGQYHIIPDPPKGD